jgi:hypothetical protein
MSAPHDAPSIAQMVEALREWMERDVITGSTGRLQFHARVARNMLAMIERELELGDVHARDHGARLARLGCIDDADLAARIRDGHLDDAYEQVRAEVEAAVREKLAVANPTYVEK